MQYVVALKPLPALLRHNVIPNFTPLHMHKCYFIWFHAKVHNIGNGVSMWKKHCSHALYSVSKFQGCSKTYWNKTKKKTIILEKRNGNPGKNIYWQLWTITCIIQVTHCCLSLVMSKHQWKTWHTELELQQDKLGINFVGEKWYRNIPHEERNWWWGKHGMCYCFQLAQNIFQREVICSWWTSNRMISNLQKRSLGKHSCSCCSMKPPHDVMDLWCIISFKIKGTKKCSADAK